MSNIIDPNLKFNGNLKVIQLSNIDSIAIHHMDATNCTIYDVHDWHLKNGWAGIGYNFWVSKKGDIYLGRGFGMAAGVQNENDHIMSIGCEGNFDKEDKLMSDAQFNAVIDVINHIKLFCNIKFIDGHKKWTNTTCPGKYFPLDEIKTLTKREELGMDKIKELEDRIKQLEDKNKVYHYWSELPTWALPSIDKAYNKGIFKGNSPEDLNLSEDLMKFIVILDMNKMI